MYKEDVELEDDSVFYWEDIEDETWEDIRKEAAETGESPDAIAERFVNKMNELLANVQLPPAIKAARRLCCIDRDADYGYKVVV